MEGGALGFLGAFQLHLVIIIKRHTGTWTPLDDDEEGGLVV